MAVAFRTVLRALCLTACAATAWAHGQQAAAPAPTPAHNPTHGPAASAPATAPAAGARAPVAGAKPASVAKPASKAMPKGVQRPYWDALNPAQKAALQPLAAEWDKQPNLPKKKWVEIANRFHTLTPDEQQRVHERMRDWIKLTPAQRALARDNYTRAKKLAPTGKSEQWQQYQQLPEAQKRKLAAEEANKKRPPVTTPPAKAGPPPLAPIKPGTTLPALLPPASVTEPARSGSSALRPAEQDRRGITVEALAPPNV